MAIGGILANRFSGNLSRSLGKEGEPHCLSGIPEFSEHAGKCVLPALVIGRQCEKNPGYIMESRPSPFAWHGSIKSYLLPDEFLTPAIPQIRTVEGYPFTGWEWFKLWIGLFFFTILWWWANNITLSFNLAWRQNKESWRESSSEIIYQHISVSRKHC